MNWRRGFLLAGIHMMVASVSLVWQEIPNWRYIKSHSTRISSTQLHSAAWQEGTITFNPCDGGFVDGEISPLEKIVEMANLPVSLVSGWHAPCRTPSPITNRTEELFGKSNQRAEIAVTVSLSILVAIQWFMLGGFPLVQHQPGWREPGAFITACTVAGAVLTGIPCPVPLWGIPLLLIMVTWFWWFGLLVWRTLTWGWRWGWTAAKI